MMRVLVGDGSGGMAWENLSIEEILSLATTHSLLSEANTYTLSGALSSERAEEFFDIAKDLAASPHTFVFTEEKLLKKVTERLTKAGAHVVAHTPPPKAEPFNIFALTYAFAARDKKKLWLLLTAVLRAGIAPEAVAGILHWKVRDLRGKSSPAFSPEELADTSRQLVALYHDSHRGGGDLALLLERFVLLL